MPGRFFLTRPMAEIAAAFDADPIEPDPPRFNVSPGQEILTMTPDGLTRMRWGLIPQGRVNARGRPVMEVLVNARSETVFAKSAFTGLKRAVVPADGWYEWTGKARKKTAWSITPKDGSLLFFAAVYDIWQGPGGVEVPQVATVTCEPNADVCDIHHRMGVLLSTDEVTEWTTGLPNEAARLMQPWPAGRLTVREAQDIDWDGP